MLDFLTSQLLLWPVIIPLSAAALSAVLWTRRGAQRWVSLTATVIMTLASIALLVQVSRGETLVMTFGGWDPPFGISFVVDRLSAAMVAISGVLALAVGLFGLAEIRARQERAGYYPLLHGLLAAVNGAFLTGDIFNLYVWFEIMLITALGLLLLDRTRAQLEGTFKYAVLNLLSTLLILLAIAVLYGVTGTLNMADLARVVPALTDSPALALSGAMFLIGFGIKAGYFPLFFWLPASYHTATPTVGALFAGLLTKVGVYASFRVFALLFDGGSSLRDVIALMAAGTMLFGVFGAAIHWDVRRILSFHIISQVGYMLLGLALATPLAVAGAIFYIIHHIIVKANLFLVAGAMRAATGTYDIRQAGGLMRSHPLLAVAFAVPAMSLAGIPPLSGFWAKYMVIDASFKGDGAWLAAVGLFVGLMTIFSMSKIWIEAFWKAPPAGDTTRRRVPLVMLAPILALCALTLWIGLGPEPFVEYANAAGEALLNPEGYELTVLGEAPLPGGAR